jgi:hypothetical protein
MAPPSLHAGCGGSGHDRWSDERGNEHAVIIAHMLKSGCDALDEEADAMQVDDHPHGTCDSHSWRTRPESAKRSLRRK